KQNESCREHQRQSLWTQNRALSFLQRNGIVADLSTGIVVHLRGILARQPSSVNLSIGLLPSRAVAQARDAIEICSGSFPLAAGVDRSVNIRIQRSGHAFRENSDHHVWFALQADCLPDD